MAESIPSVFESNNARHLSPIKVARSFVPPFAFEELCQRGNAIVVGPRGSGKTTLLKMLQPTALLSWNGIDAQRFISRIDFAGVFISADAIFAEELKFYRDIKGKGGDVEIQGQLFRHSRYVTHCLASFMRALDELKSLRSRTQRELGVAKADYLERVMLPLSRGEEAELVDELAKLWRLEVGVRTITGLMSSLTARHTRTREIYLTCSGMSATQLYENHPFLALNLPDCIRHVVDVLHHVCGVARATPWAFLFDELEIVPDELRQNIFGLQRGGITNVLLKLTMFATTPIEREVKVEYRPRGRDDFAYIPLWYSYKERSYEFCAGLFKQMVVDRPSSPRDVSTLPPMAVAETVLGPSRFDLGRRLQREGKEVYAEDSEVLRDLRELEGKDAGLREYLVSRGLQLGRLAQLPQDQRAATIRKLASIAVVRNEFRKEDATTGHRLRRSRKSPTIYSGATTVFSISEGNPRVLIGLSDPMIERWIRKRGGVPAGVQGRYVTFWSNRFQALLSNYMMERSDREPHRSPSKEIAGLTEILGRIFERNVHDRKFNGDPVLTFVVDAKTSSSERDAVAVALNAGALVHIPESSNRPLGSDVVGHRFRLSYLFAPRYRLPLIVGKERALSDLLRRRSDLDLFEESKR